MNGVDVRIGEQYRVNELKSGIDFHELASPSYLKTLKRSEPLWGYGLFDEEEFDAKIRNRRSHRDVVVRKGFTFSSLQLWECELPNETLALFHADELILVEPDDTDDELF